MENRALQTLWMRLKISCSEIVAVDFPRKVATIACAVAWCSSAASAPLTRDPAPPAPVKSQEGKAMDTRVGTSGRFANLDAYLAYLEKRSHIDGAWYRQVRPGIYELQPGNLRLQGAEPQKRTFTREELEKKFGFTR
jgi:hypothetical protein